MIYLLLFPAILILFLFYTLYRVIRSHGPFALTWRFILGRPLNGIRKTDATFFRHATRITHPSGRAGRWSHLPDYHRSAIRNGSVLTLAAFTYGILTSPALTIYATGGFFLAGIIISQHVLYRKFRTYHHTHHTVTPLATAIAPYLALSPVRAHDSISIRPDWKTSKGMDLIGTVILPDEYAANSEQRHTAEHLIGSRLGLDLTFTWHTARHPMTLEIFRAPIPPAMVPLPSVLPVIRALPRGKVLLGPSGRGVPKIWDMTGEDPHCAVSANTRRGKTRLLLLIAAQVLSQGSDHVTVIDPKRVGVDECLAGIPGVIVLNNPRDIPSMWQGIHDFRLMMDGRVDAYMADRTLEFSRALLIIDEVSQFASQSKQVWDTEFRTKKDPAIPPVWNDVKAILWQGAQFGCSVLVFGQRVDFAMLGGALDSFGTRLLAGYTKRTFERLIGTTPVPQSSRIRGRFVHFDGDETTLIQTVLGTDQELRDLAMPLTVTRAPVPLSLPAPELLRA